MRQRSRTPWDFRRRGLLALALGLWAGSAAAAPVTLEEATRRALAANPSLRMARLEVIAAHERTLQAYARHLGDADLVALANHFEGARLVRPITGPVTPASMASLPFDANQAHAGLAWQIPLFVGGALVESDRAASLLEAAARAQGEHAEAELRYNVRAAYRNALSLGHALDTARAWETALEKDEAAARLRLQTEAWASADALKVGFALATATSRRVALDAQRRTALGLVAALMGEESPDLELVDAPAASPPDLGGAGRQDLVALRQSAEAQERRVAAVRAGFWPQLALAGNAFLNAGLSSPVSAPTLEVTLLVKLPLLASVGRVSALSEAEAAAAASRERARARALEIRTQVLDARGRVDAARAAVVAGAAQRTLGAEVARVEKLKLDAGTGKIEDYLLALAQQFEGEAADWQARYSLETALDYLALATGNRGAP